MAGVKLLVAVLGVAGVAGAAYLQIHRVRASRPRVWTEAVRAHDVRATVTASGRARAAREIIVSVADDGRVRSVLVRAGQVVRSGQAVLSLDGQPGRINLDHARSRAAAAAADVRRAGADADRLRAERDLAWLSLQRAESLAAAGATTEELLARSRHDLRQAELARAAGVEAVEAARARMRIADADVLDAASRTTRQVVRAPVDAAVAEILVQPGEPVHAGGTHVPPSRLVTFSAAITDIEVTLDRRSAARLRPGGHASVAIPGFEARVVTIDEGGGGEAAVRARLDAPPRGLRPGMSATVRFTTAWQPDRLAVPNHAVIRGRDAADTRVWTVRGGVIALVPVVLGLRGDFHSEVLAGLTPGTLVVTGPAAIIRTLGIGDRAVAIPAAVQTP